MFNYFRLLSLDIIFNKYFFLFLSIFIIIFNILNYNNYFKISYSLFLFLIPITIFLSISGYNQFLGFFLVVEISAIVLINITVLDFKFNYFNLKYNKWFFYFIFINIIILLLYYSNPIDIINMSHYFLNSYNNELNNLGVIVILLYSNNYYIFLISFSFLIFTIYIVFFINNKNIFYFKSKKNILIKNIIEFKLLFYYIKNKIEFYNTNINNIYFG